MKPSEAAEHAIRSAFNCSPAWPGWEDEVAREAVVHLEVEGLLATKKQRKKNRKRARRRAQAENF